MAFYVVYIQEAHSSDVWQMPSNIRDKVIFQTPQSFDERTEVATSCVRKLGIKIPAIVDDMNNSTERAYTGWPDRIYLIDRNGRVVLKTKPGPFGFNPSLLDKAASAHRASRPELKRRQVVDPIRAQAWRSQSPEKVSRSHCRNFAIQFLKQAE